jgi:hypothetical protein
MNRIKLFSLAALSSLVNASVWACPEICPSSIEGDQFESTAITLGEHSLERAWQVLEKGLENYDVVCQNEEAGRLLISCAPGSKNVVLVWTEKPVMDEGVLPRSMVHVLSACTPAETVNVLDLQNDILDAAEALSPKNP